MCVACVATLTAVSFLSPTVPAEIQPVEKNINISRPCPKSKLNQIKDNLICTKNGKKYRWTPVNNIEPIKSQVDLVYSDKVADKSECQLKEARVIKTQPSSVGFPLTKTDENNTVLKNLGTINMIYIPIDFPDFKGNQDFLDKLQYHIDKINNWYSFFSNNKLKVSYQTSNKWFTASQKSEYYNTGKLGPNMDNPYASQWDSFAQDFINSTGNHYDFTNVDVVLFYFPPGSTDNIKSDILGRHNIEFNTPQGKKKFMYSGGGKEPYGIEKNLKNPYSRIWGFWLHEILHSHGLAVHAPGNGWQIGVGTNQQGDSLSISTSWELFLLDWLNDNQIYCLPVEKIKSNIVEMTPLEVSGDKNKIVAIPLDKYRSIVLDSRRPVGFSSDWDKGSSGILASIVDTRLDNDRSCESSCTRGPIDNGNDRNYSKWSYYLIPDNPQIYENVFHQHSYRNYFLKKGMTLSFENVIIKVLESDKTDTVLIERKS